MEVKTASDTREVCEISFAGGAHGALHLTQGTALSNALNASNSPVLFGCRTGICGTCRIEVMESSVALPPPSELEAETLELYAEGIPRARLACQLRVLGHLKIKKLAPF